MDFYDYFNDIGYSVKHISKIPYEDFITVSYIRHNKLVQQKQIINRGAEQVLKILFDFSVIGNDPSIKNQAIFKYEKDAARFNFRENIIVHRGLYKALQIF
ncbi:hypothetical protein GH810_00545 [Acetobacterium paludosum]|uniref:Uncharacterized protein n=1 Tax=Acetobacterium paludosum TaxID=52693 RepID=A0A923KUT1_9FIRM|nr:hypothetical protein [Acetobacterium paludosum]MBC3886805.1 hypothetical protein [Acetobacterium paludosum]